MSSTVTHYKRDWAEGYDQPNDLWTHDLWYVAHCPLCETERGTGPGTKARMA